MSTMMFSTAKALAIAGIRQRQENLSDAELRGRLFLQFYGSEFSESQKRMILDSIRRGARGEEEL